MVNLNDYVYVYKPEFNIYWDKMKVVRRNVPEYVEFMGENNIVVENEDGDTFVVSRKNYIENIFDSIDKLESLQEKIEDFLVYEKYKKGGGNFFE